MYVITNSPKSGEKRQVGPFASLRNARTFLNEIAINITYDGEPLEHDIQKEPISGIQILPAPKGW